MSLRLRHASVVGMLLAGGLLATACGSTAPAPSAPTSPPAVIGGNVPYAPPPSPTPTASPSTSPSASPSHSPAPSPSPTPTATTPQPEPKASQTCRKTGGKSTSTRCRTRTD
ncbi:hypothetical protein [Kitasatospora sp. CB01950]|uniref:hypothetical protein n=1 Tax=Kitasatospora sp. CB01950 TaxID=1703930 RepID=UPI0018E977CD|nr:hypothetical protein [Kitasatospora sp. CB01950]